jgi:hypothetical protein
MRSLLDELVEDAALRERLSPEHQKAKQAQFDRDKRRTDFVMLAVAIAGATMVLVPSIVAAGMETNWLGLTAPKHPSYIVKQPRRNNRSERVHNPSCSRHFFCHHYKLFFQYWMLFPYLTLPPRVLSYLYKTNT